MIEPSALLPWTKAGELQSEPPDEAWLIRPLWGRRAAGLIGGSPKSCKSWLGLDIAVSVASGTPCLGRFPVEKRGNVLVYLAEDSPPMIRSRLEGICRHREIDLASLPIDVITAPVLRLDLEADQKRLEATVERLRPSLLLLDPLIRLHRLDENRSSEISGLLSYLRGLQRRFDLALVLVHHASKRHRARPGLALRGSSDLFAWGDSYAYLAWQGEGLLLTLEHRAASTPDPVPLALVAEGEGNGAHLEVRDEGMTGGGDRDPSLADAVLRFLRHAPGPATRTAMRAALRVNNQKLGHTLEALEQAGRILRTPTGWTRLRDEPELPFQGSRGPRRSE